MDKDFIKDFISADDAGSLPQDYTPCKEKVMSFMEEVYKEDTRHWAAVKTISKGSDVSAVYTRHVLDQLQDERLIERGMIGKKAYYRFIPKN